MLFNLFVNFLTSFQQSKKPNTSVTKIPVFSVAFQSSLGLEGDFELES